MTVEVKSVPKHPPGYIVGVDLGQARDYTAICVLEYTDRQTGRSRQRRVGNWATGGASDLVPETEHVYQVRSAADRKSTGLNSSHVAISYAVFCLKKKKIHQAIQHRSRGGPHAIG